MTTSRARRRTFVDRVERHSAGLADARTVDAFHRGRRSPVAIARAALAAELVDSRPGEDLAVTDELLAYAVASSGYRAFSPKGGPR